MPPILTVTLNPALDLAGTTPRVTAGPKLRVTGLTIEPGGGGINVARVIHRLGGEVIALASLGGPTGARIADLLEAEGLQVRTVAAPGDTRQSLAVTDESDGAQYRFVLPGPEWDAGAEDAALDATAKAAPAGALVVLSGSQPPGVAADFPQRLADALAARGARLIVDTSGPALERLLRHPDASARPDVLRLDEREAEALAGGAIADASASLDLAENLVSRGVARTVVMARGADGSVLAAPGLRLHVVPPRVNVLSAVGAGDSFTGAFTLALARGADLEEALRQGTAAAAAAVITPATELCHPEDVARLMPGCRVFPA
jgi:6-phosphofructokinase 2